MRLCLLALLAFASPAFASSTQWEAERAACISNAQTLGALMDCRQVLFFACTAEKGGDSGNECQTIEAQAWDSDLNLLWAEVAAMAREEGLEADLLSAQKAWLGWREAQCIYAQRKAEQMGADPVWEVQFCLSDLTAQRSFDFRLMLGDGLGAQD